MYMGLFGPDIVVRRALFATPAHVMFASMWGYSMGLARFRREGELLTIARGFLIAASLHGFYNFLVAVYPGTAMLSLIPLMAFMGWLMNYRIQEFRKKYPFPSLGEGALISCPNCGAYTLESSDRCGRCGFAVPLLETDAPRFCGHCRARTGSVPRNLRQMWRTGRSCQPLSSGHINCRGRPTHRVEDLGQASCQRIKLGLLLLGQEDFRQALQRN